MAITENLTEQDLAIIETLDSGNQTQRQIAEEVGLSLGMVNLLIKKLVIKGYVKVKKINTRRFFYYLTPAAIEEKTKKTYTFIKKTVKSLGLIKAKIREEILRKYKEGYRSFNIIRHSELTDISLIVFMDLQKKLSDISFQETEKVIDDSKVCNIIDKQPDGCSNCLDLVKVLVRND